MNQPVFPSHTDCTECPLSANCKNPGLPTRSLFFSSQKTALLVVGEAPGYHEDLQNTSWIGFSGQLLTRFIEACNFPASCDVYLTNACRCRPEFNSNPTDGQTSKCQAHLQHDLNILTDQYPHVVVLCCGAKAIRSVTRLSSITKSLTYQGRTLSFFNNLISRGKPALTVSEGKKDVPVFFTYHPAILAPGRKPALVTAVQDHFNLLRRYLGGTYTVPTLNFTPEFGPAPVFPSSPPPIVCLDIETYGILKGQDQTVFHPAKSFHIDSIPYDSQVITVCLTYELADSKYRTLIFDFKRHRSLLIQWLTYFLRSKSVILGQNIKFDIQYLKYCDSTLNQLITPSTTILDDTLLWSFLLYEQRPERGLKELSRLFGLADYSSLSVTGSSGTATGPDDPDLHYYNCLDTVATLRLRKYAIEEISRTYGPNSSKLSSTCSAMRNWAIWDVIDLETSGFTYHLPALKHLQSRLQTEKDIIESRLSSTLILSGTGSEASKRTFLHNNLESIGLLTNPQIQLTEKKKDLSISSTNFDILAANLPEDHPNRYTIELIQRHTIITKQLGTYINHLCTKSKKGYVHRLPSETVISYPSWFPWPSYQSKSDTGSSDNTGGTIQARFSCKGPALQTFPPVVKKMMVSRFGAHGYIAGYDESQIELRVAAFLSGDPVMLSEYAQGIDRHTITGLLFAPDADPSSPEFRSTYRQLGKTLNFLVLYLGGALKFQETALNNLGLSLSVSQCQEVIYKFDVRYSHFRSWQKELLASAARNGYIITPTGWSRSFSTGSSAIESYRNEICNFPIQLTAAQLLQSAEFAIIRELRRLHTRSCVVAQIHDALYLDIYRPEEKIIDQIVEKYLTRPPLLSILESQLNRTIPLEIEKEIMGILTLDDIDAIVAFESPLGGITND